MVVSLCDGDSDDDDIMMVCFILMSCDGDGMMLLVYGVVMCVMGCDDSV